MNSAINIWEDIYQKKLTGQERSFSEWLKEYDLKKKQLKI